MSSKISERARVTNAILNQAISDGVEPSCPRGSSQFALPLGSGKRALLVRSHNSFTKEREYWSAQTGKPLPEGIDFRQKPVTEGASQIIDVRGKKTRIRTWDPADNKCVSIHRRGCAGAPTSRSKWFVNFLHLLGAETR